MLVLPQQTRVSQPQSGASIDWSNPITKGLMAAFNSAYPLSNPVNRSPATGQTGTGITTAYSKDLTLKNFSGSGTGKYQYATNAETDKVTFIWSGYINLTNSSLARIISHYNGAGLGRFDIYVGQGSAEGIYFQALRATTNGNWQTSNAFKVVNGIFAVTYDGSSTSNIPKFYINGSLYTGTITTMNSPAGALVTAGKNISVGGRLDVTTRQLAGSLSFAAAWNRDLTAPEIFSLSQNLWQIFQPDRSAIFLPATSVTLTYLRPSADISTGSWAPSAGTTLYETLDEVSASDADYIQTQAPSTCEIQLSAGSAPLAKTNHTLKYSLLAGSGTITVSLVQGTTIKKTWNHTLTGSTQQISNTLTEAEANTITDYSDLRVRFET